MPALLSNLTDEVAFRWRLPNEWVGIRFSFLPAKKGMEDVWYDAIRDSSGRMVPYATYVGRICRVTAVDYKSLDKNGGVYYLSLRMEDTGEQLTGNAYDLKDKGVTMMMCMAPTDEIACAKKRFTGQTLYYRMTWVTMEDPASGATASFKVSRYSPLLITGVGPSTDSMMPIRLHVKTSSGRTGYVDTACSGTNTMATAKQMDERSYPGLIDAQFIDHDLHTEHPNWSSEVWDAIEKLKVVRGMSPEQAELAVSQPQSKRSTENSERWDYGDGRFIHFLNGKVDTFSY